MLVTEEKYSYKYSPTTKSNYAFASVYLHKLSQ